MDIDLAQGREFRICLVVEDQSNCLDNHFLTKSHLKLSKNALGGQSYKRGNLLVAIYDPRHHIGMCEECETEEKGRARRRKTSHDKYKTYLVHESL